MTKEELLEKMKEYKNDVYVPGYYSDNKEKPEFSQKGFPAFVSNSWRTGGLTGGNCWGGNADTAVESGEEPEINELDNFLTDCYPELPFLQYKKLKNFIKYEDFTESEYYGNYTEHKMKYILFEDIINIIEPILKNTNNTILKKKKAKPI